MSESLEVKVAELVVQMGTTTKTLDEVCKDMKILTSKLVENQQTQTQLLFSMQQTQTDMSTTKCDLRDITNRVAVIENKISKSEVACPHSDKLEDEVRLQDLRIQQVERFIFVATNRWFIGGVAGVIVSGTMADFMYHREFVYNIFKKIFSLSGG